MRSAAQTTAHVSSHVLVHGDVTTNADEHAENGLRTTIPEIIRFHPTVPGSNVLMEGGNFSNNNSDVKESVGNRTGVSGFLGHHERSTALDAIVHDTVSHISQDSASLEPSNPHLWSPLTGAPADTTAETPSYTPGIPASTSYSPEIAVAYAQKLAKVEMTLQAREDVS